MYFLFFFNENYINYQNYEITVPVKFRNNEVKKITFYYENKKINSSQKRFTYTQNL